MNRPLAGISHRQQPGLAPGLIDQFPVAKRILDQLNQTLLNLIVGAL
jgi:hypothetical protein